jgi:CheY-like chemotaxis protein
MSKKILLADDSLTIQKVVELTFSDSEYDLVCVSNGQRALDRIAGGDVPDLILADVVMPEKNGYEVCEAIKSSPAMARVPVVLLSGTFEPFDRDRAERLGCDAIVSKPFDSQQLLRQVEALLARPAAEVTVAATMAIPIMPSPVAPPAPAAPSAESYAAPASEPGFQSEDFTASIRVPAQVAGGADMFEEEYGQADVESAIAAFEKEHPEFTYAEDGHSEAAMMSGDVAEAAPEESRPPESTGARWLHEEAEAAAPPPPIAPAPFWVPREPEPDVTPIPFGADDTQSRRPTGPVPAASASTEPESMRADEAPTQQIPLAAEYAALGRRHDDAAPDRDTDETEPHRSAEGRAAKDRGSEDRTDEISVTRDVAPVPAPAAAEPAPTEPSAVPTEIEVLAQTTSIGQLKEMLSSVSRPEGGLTDDELDRLASRVVERLSERIVREIAWEVIPDVAEIVIKQRIRELEAGVE